LSTGIATATIPAMMNLILVGAGGFFGAISRYGVSQIFHESKFHYGTLVVNLVGCLLIGVAFGFLSREAIAKPAQLLLITGFLGGFTTFSTFSLDTLKMIHDGAVMNALAYVAVSAILGIALVAAGYELAK
jgi:CrcB protein